MAGDRDDKNSDSVLDPSTEPTQVEPHDPLVGQLLGKYQIISHIAEGGTATVYRAMDSVLNREVAVKILHSHLGEKKEVAARFKKEAQFIAQLRHSNILTVYDFFEHQGRAVLVVEFMPGMTLAELIKDSQKIPENFALMLGLEILKGLQAAHDKGIIHRDVKPANVLLNPELGVKISDFGLAKVTQYDDGLTKDGIFVGTPSFSSPEQIEGKPLDARSDIFSFGLTLYILATRKHAFKQRGDSTTTVWFKTVKGKFDAIRQVDASLSVELERIVERCLQVDRDKRYASVQDVIREVESVLSRRGFANYQDKLKAFLKDPQSFLSQSSSQSRWTALRSKPLLLGVAGVFVLGLGFLSWKLMAPKAPAVVESESQAPIAVEKPAAESPGEVSEVKPEAPAEAIPPVDSQNLAEEAPKPVKPESRAVKKSSAVIVPSALPLKANSSVILFSQNNQPGYRWTWGEPSSFLLARDAKFSNLVVKETELRKSFDMGRLNSGTYFWRAGRESGSLAVKVYQPAKDRRIPVSVRSSFGEAVELDLNPWTQNLKLDWSGGPRASAYVLEVSTDADFKNLLFRGALVQTSYVLDRVFSETQKIFWRVSYEDESRNVFFVEPVRSIQLKVAGFAPRLDLSRMPGALKSGSKFWSVDIGAPATASIQCQIVSSGGALTSDWTPLKKSTSSFGASLGVKSSPASLICSYRDNGAESFLVMP
jgi:serine/threonine protein kinase